MPDRAIDNDAPATMRIEWVGIAFDRSSKSLSGQPTLEGVYDIINGTLGITNPAVQPYGGIQKRAGQHVLQAPWPRFYDLLLRLWHEFHSQEEDGEYTAAVNKLLAAHGIVWQLTDDGKLERVLPTPIQIELKSAIDELRKPGFEAALQLFELAHEAFNDRPRRDRDAGANAFDAMEAAAKTKMDIPTGTFGAALDVARNAGRINTQIAEVLRRVEVVRHNHLGHGMTMPFALLPDEVDLVYVTCALGARLFARLQ